MAFQNSVTRTSELIADLIRTDDPPNTRWEMGSDVGANTLYGYTGDPDETGPGLITVQSASPIALMSLQAPNMDAGSGPVPFPATIGLIDHASVPLHSEIRLLADRITIGLALQEIGRKAQASIATNNGIGLSTETLRLTAGPFTAYNGQRYRITGKSNPQSNTAASYTQMKLKYSVVAAGVAGTLVDHSLKDHRVAARSETLHSFGEFVYGGVDGDQLYVKMTLDNQGGTGTDAAGTYPSTILTVDAIG